MDKSTVQFNAVVAKRLESIKSILQKKAVEYSSDGNRFHNFDKAAQITNQSAERCLWNFAMKHLVSVDDIVEQEKWFYAMTTQDKAAYVALIDEKIGDMINYLILLEGIIKRDIGGIDVRNDKRKK